MTNNQLIQLLKQSHITLTSNEKQTTFTKIVRYDFTIINLRGDPHSIQILLAKTLLGEWEDGLCHHAHRYLGSSRVLMKDPRAVGHMGPTQDAPVVLVQVSETIQNKPKPEISWKSNKFSVGIRKNNNDKKKYPISCNTCFL